VTLTAAQILAWISPPLMELMARRAVVDRVSVGVVLKVFIVESVSSRTLGLWTAYVGRICEIDAYFVTH